MSSIRVCLISPVPPRPSHPLLGGGDRLAGAAWCGLTEVPCGDRIRSDAGDDSSGLTMKKQKHLFAVLVFLILLPALASSQQLTIRAENGKQTVLARADIDALPHVKVTTNASGTSTTFEGVSLKSVLQRGRSRVRTVDEGKTAGVLPISGGC